MLVQGSLQCGDSSAIVCVLQLVVVMGEQGVCENEREHKMNESAGPATYPSCAARDALVTICLCLQAQKANSSLGEREHNTTQHTGVS